MKKMLMMVSVISVLSLHAQTETFDIASFTPPKGWQRIDSNGTVAFFNSKTTNGLTSFCQLFLYPSRASNSSPEKNFQAEWTNHVAKTTGNKTIPKTETEKTPDGWTVLTGTSNITNKGITYTCILSVISGFGRVMTVMINVAGKEYTEDIQTFFEHLDLRAPAGPGVNWNGNTPPLTGTASLGNYIYKVPGGWTTTQYPDGIVLSSPVSNTGEKCNITLWPMRPASGNLQNDAGNLFKEVFKTFVPKQGSTQPSILRGTSARGWDYFIIKQGIVMPGGDYQAMFGFVFVAKLDNQLAAISGISKDPMVSSCFGLQLRDVWPEFFYSLQFKNWYPPAQPTPVSPVMKKIPGVWTAAIGTASDRFVFAPNGRFAGAAAAQRYIQMSSTELLRITDAYFGEGAYSMNNNQIILTYDSDKNNPENGLIRVEQESYDGGRTWVDKLYLLRKNVVDGAEFEAVYDKQ
jgi:hypothetical protein